MSDTYLEQLKQSADWAGTYLSGVSGTSSGPQHVDGDRISKAVELLTQLRDHAEKRPMRTHDAGLCVMANRVADDVDEVLELLKCE